MMAIEDTYKVEKLTTSTGVQPGLWEVFCKELLLQIRQDGLTALQPKTLPKSSSAQTPYNVNIRYIQKL